MPYRFASLFSVAVGLSACFNPSPPVLDTDQGTGSEATDDGAPIAGTGSTGGAGHDDDDDDDRPGVTTANPDTGAADESTGPGADSDASAGSSTDSGTDSSTGSDAGSSTSSDVDTDSDTDGCNDAPGAWAACAAGESCMSATAECLATGVGDESACTFPCETACDCPAAPPTSDATVSCEDIVGPGGPDGIPDCFLGCETDAQCPDGQVCFEGVLCVHP